MGHSVGTSGTGPGLEEGEKRYPDLPPVPSSISPGPEMQGQGERGSLGKSVLQQSRENNALLSRGPDMGESSASQDQKDRNVPHEIRSESPTQGHSRSKGPLKKNYFMWSRG